MGLKRFLISFTKQIGVGDPKEELKVPTKFIRG